MNSCARPGVEAAGFDQLSTAPRGGTSSLAGAACSSRHVGPGTVPGCGSGTSRHRLLGSAWRRRPSEITLLPGRCASVPAASPPAAASRRCKWKPPGAALGPGRPGAGGPRRTSWCSFPVAQADGRGADHGQQSRQHAAADPEFAAYFDDPAEQRKSRSTTPAPRSSYPRQGVRQEDAGLHRPQAAAGRGPGAAPGSSDQVAPMARSSKTALVAVNRYPVWKTRRSSSAISGQPPGRDVAELRRGAGVVAERASPSAGRRSIVPSAEDTRRRPSRADFIQYDGHSGWARIRRPRRAGQGQGRDRRRAQPRPDRPDLHRRPEPVVALAALADGAACAADVPGPRPARRRPLPDAGRHSRRRSIRKADSALPADAHAAARTRTSAHTGIALRRRLTIVVHFRDAQPGARGIAGLIRCSTSCPTSSWVGEPVDGAGLEAPIGSLKPDVGQARAVGGDHAEHPRPWRNRGQRARQSPSR